MNRNSFSQITRYGVSVVAVAAAVVITLLIRSVFSLNPTPLILTAVIVSAWYGGKYPGLFAALLCDLAIDYFFEDPPYQFTLATVHIVRFGILAVISLLVSARKKTEDKLKARERQQAAVAELGQQALSAIPLKELFDAATNLVSKTLNTDYCAVYELLPAENKLRVKAGSGWKTDFDGVEFEFTPSNTFAGYILNTGKPEIFKNLKKLNRFTPSDVLIEHGVNSGLGVAIRHHGQDFGVLSAFTRKTRVFSEDDVNFLQSIANVLAEAVERMRSEEIVREQGEWLRTTLASIGDAVIATDPDGVVTFMNPVAENLTGWDETAAKGKQLKEVFQIISEKDRAEIENPVARVISEGLVIGLANHTILISKDGREIPIDDSAAPIKDKNGKISGVVLVFHDITERKKAEQEQQFMANAAAVMTASLDLEKTLSNLADLTVPALADLCIIDLIDEKNDICRLAVAQKNSSKTDLAEEIKKCSEFDLSAASGISNVLRTGKSEMYSETTGFLSCDLVCGVSEVSSLPQLDAVSAMIVPLVAHGRALGVISFLMTESRRQYGEKDLLSAEDFAHRAALAIDNARLYQTVQEANRVKDEFLATLSHELRTPLNSILGWSSLIRASELSPERVDAALETIERNAKLQKQIVEDVLDVSRIITGKFRLDIHPIDLVPIVEAAIETIRPSAMAKDIKITFFPFPDFPKISGDAGRFQQVMWNLLSNAVKFTPKGGQVEVSLGVSDSNAEIRVRDTGKGVSPDFLPFVFDRFRQADSSRTRAHGGLGLGLAIVRYIVELHGGEIKVESEGENLGATFIINFPIMPVLNYRFDSARMHMSQSASPELIGENSLENLKILVVEDDPDARSMLVMILEQHGASVNTASSSPEGLASLQNKKADIVVSDIGMPEEDGYDFIKKVRALDSNGNHNIPAIALTAYAREEDRVEALRAGYQMHLAKPVEPTELVIAIKSLIS